MRLASLLRGFQVEPLMLGQNYIKFLNDFDISFKPLSLWLSFAS